MGIDRASAVSTLIGCALSIVSALSSFSAELPCEQLCSGSTNPGGIESTSVAELCNCINFHGLSAEQFSQKIESLCGKDEGRWAEEGGKKKLYQWARKTTDNVCTEGAPCSFDAAVQAIHRASSQDKSKDIQCAFSLLGWSMDPDPDGDQIFGQPARRIRNSGILVEGNHGKKAKWPKDIQEIIDGTARRYFKSGRQES